MELRNELIENGKRALNRVRHQIAYLDKPHIRRILDTVEYLVTKHKLEVYKECSAFGSGIYLTANDLEGLKDESLTALLDSLVHSDPVRTENRDNPSTFSRSYYFWSRESNRSFAIDDVDGSLLIAVTANFKEDSETCKRIIVGYKAPSTEPTPIYELKCVDPNEPTTPEGDLDPRLTHL